MPTLYRYWFFVSDVSYAYGGTMKHQKNRKRNKSHNGRPLVLSTHDIEKYVDTKSAGHHTDWKESIREVFKPTQRQA